MSFSFHRTHDKLKMVQEKQILPVIAIPIHKLFVFFHHLYSYIEKFVMSKASQLLKTLMLILSAVYGVAIIYMTALPVGDTILIVQPQDEKGVVSITVSSPKLSSKGAFSVVMK